MLYICVKLNDAMETTTYSNFRQNLKSMLDNVLNHRIPLFVSRKNAEDVVVIPRSDYESLRETLHLFGSKTNAARLFESIEQVEKGKIITKSIDELDALAE